MDSADPNRATVKKAYTTTWEPAVTVSTPAVPFAGTPSLTSSMSGTLANASSASTVNLYVDGSSTPISASASSGSWSIPLASVSNGLHRYRLEAQWGTWSKSTSLTGYFAKSVVPTRISGADRYDTSAEVARKFSSASIVYIASGENYPDALSAAPAAAHGDAPLMLVGRNFITPSVQAQLTRLNPGIVVVVGGTSVITDSVKATIQSLLPSSTVIRRSGADRYATSRAVTSYAFGPVANTTTNVFVATGTNFPDALSASAAAGKLDAPVILVYGPGATIDAATHTLIGTTFPVQQVYIAGSAVVVSSGIQSQIDALSGVAVTRLAGADRYATSVAINSNIFSTATTAYLAVGTGYADALAGAALAGSTGSPLFVVPGNCIPDSVMVSMASMGVSSITLLGGPTVLSPAVQSLTVC